MRLERIRLLCDEVSRLQATQSVEVEAAGGAPTIALQFSDRARRIKFVVRVAVDWRCCSTPLAPEAVWITCKVRPTCVV
jgi:hypothetical protein